MHVKSVLNAMSKNYTSCGGRTWDTKIFWFTGWNTFVQENFPDNKIVVKCLCLFINRVSRNLQFISFSSLQRTLEKLIEKEHHTKKLVRQERLFIINKTWKPKVHVLIFQ